MLGAKMTNDAVCWCFWAQGSSLRVGGNYRLIYGQAGVGSTIDEGINTGPGQPAVR